MKRPFAFVSALVLAGILALVFHAADSSAADVAAVGAIMIPALIKRGCPPARAAALQAASGSMGVIIPPSISFIIYGVLTGCSIADLYKAGIPAGFIMGFAWFFTNFYCVVFNW